MEIRIYGETAKKIENGDTFVARVESVEGRTVVRLVKR